MTADGRREVKCDSATVGGSHAGRPWAVLRLRISRYDAVLRSLSN